MPSFTVTWPPPGISTCAICLTRCASGPILLRVGVFSMGSSLYPRGFADAVDQRRAQQKGARKLRILRLPLELLVIAAPDGRVLLHQELLVADRLSLGVLHGDMAALALVEIKQRAI